MRIGDPKVIRGWTMYDWANSVYSLTITSAVFPIFYVAVTEPQGQDLVKEKIGIPAASMYSYALSAGFLIVALIAPLLSGIADHSGNKKSYLKMFCYLGAASCAGLFFFDPQNVIPGLILVMLACAGFSGSLIFYDAFLPEIAERKDHDRISARGYTMGYIGSVILLILNLLMVMKPGVFGIPDRDGLPARLTFLTVGIWWAGFAQFAFSILPDRTAPITRNENVVLSGYRELRKTWNQLKRSQRLKKYLAAFFMLNMGIQTVMYLAVSYAKREIKDIGENGSIIPIGDASLIISILIIQLVAIVGAFLFVRLSSRFGNVKALMIGCSVWILLCLAAYRIQWATEFYALAAGVGLVMGGSQALARSTYSKFLPDTKDHASYFSFYDVSYYIGTVLGTFLYGAIFHITGDLRNTVIAIGSFFVIAFVLLLLVPKREVPIASTLEE